MSLILYVGVPIRYSYKGEIYFIGTICLIDYFPRNFSNEELKILISFAFQFESLIEMRLPAQNFENLTKKLSINSIEIHDLENSIRDLQAISETDLLTNLPNRRFLENFVKEK